MHGIVFELKAIGGVGHLQTFVGVREIFACAVLDVICVAAIGYEFPHIADVPFVIVGAIGQCTITDIEVAVNVAAIALLGVGGHVECVVAAAFVASEILGGIFHLFKNIFAASIRGVGTAAPIKNLVTVSAVCLVKLRAAARDDHVACRIGRFDSPSSRGR